MLRPMIALCSLALVGACATTPPPGDAGARTIPPPPPMPTATIPAGGQPADLGTAHASACTIAIFSQVPQHVGGVQRIQADDASLTEFPAEDGNVRVAGSGRYYGAESSWEPFRFECVYDTADATITRFDIVPL